MTAQIITAVARDGEIVASDNALVPWWSFTKTALAAAALVLVERGELQLDTPIENQPFTLRQLLQHRAGVPEYGALKAYHSAVAAGDLPWSVSELLERVDADKLQFAPGEGWSYSNVGYLYVRQILECHAGAPISEALRVFLFDPLKISSPRIANFPRDLDETAWGNAEGYHPGWVYHGLLIGSAADASLFLHQLLAGNLISSSLLAEMCNPYPVLDPGAGGRPWQTGGYGLGLMIGRGTPDALYVGHTGGGPGSTSAVYQRVEDKVSRCTASVFAPLDDSAVVERRALDLSYGNNSPFKF